jgi:hypothetical protein
MWKVIYICPLIWAVIQLVLIKLLFPEEPILYSLSNGNEQEARILINKVYKKDVDCDKLICRMKESLGTNASNISFYEALFGH